MNEMNLFEDTNWHENIENIFIKIENYRTGKSKLLGGIVYWTDSYYFHH